MKDRMRIFKDNQAVARAFADFLSTKLKADKIMRVAISGGSTPKLLFRILAEEYGQTIDWSQVHIFWVDERCVPPDHSESNFRMTRERLLQHIEIPNVNVHRVWGENDPDKEARQYSAVVEAGLLHSNQLPIFDIILLGMGSDGHTASIFPDRLDLLSSEKTCAVATHPQSGQKRVTLTGNVINAATAIHFLVTGESKAGVVRQIRSREGNYLDYPAAHIKNAVWWLDEAAASS